jgi:hypothetical protein
MKTRLAVVLFSVFAVMGCSVVDSEEVNPNAVHMSWSGQYDESSSQVQFTATYTMGGSPDTYLELTGGADSRVNGDSMSANHDSVFQTVDYEWGRVFSQPDEPRLDYVLEYVDDQGRSYTNTVVLPPRAMIGLGQNPIINLSSSFDVEWLAGGALGGGDHVSATISQTGASVSADDDDPAGSSGRIHFSEDELAQLRPGDAHLQVCISRWEGLSDTPDSGGNANLTYCSEVLGLRVEYLVN